MFFNDIQYIAYFMGGEEASSACSGGIKGAVGLRKPSNEPQAPLMRPLHALGMSRCCANGGATSAQLQ
jgi:hypothetical protein